MRISEKSSNFAADLGVIMSQIFDYGELSAMYRRLAYTVVAIMASLLLFEHPVFNFQDDKGIIYVRSFSMDQKTFYVTQTTLQDGVPEITATTSVKWFYYCNKAMVWGCIMSLLCFFSIPLRLTVTYLSAVVAGSYYVLVVYYSLKLADLHYTTLYPNYMIVLPGIVCAMMLLVSRNLIKTQVERIDRSMDSYDVEN